MQIDKQQIIQQLKGQGDQDKARKADEELPEQVDTDKQEDQNLLQKLGIDPMALAKQFMGGGGGGLLG